MKHSKKRILCTLLAALLLSMTSCGGSESTETTADNTDTTTVETTPAETELTLAFGSEDNGGIDFTMLTTEHAMYEYVVDELTGEIVNDAVYSRNQAVEELLGLNLSFIVEPGHWGAKDTFNGLIKNSVMAGDSAYDLVNGVTVCVIPAATDGIFLNAADLAFVDFANPWWVQGMMKNLAIGGKLFGFIGDASLSLYKDLSVVYFNKNLLDSYGLENPYDLVKDGSWTIDAMFGMVEGVSMDLDGDGKMQKDNDQFGYIAHYVPQRAFQTATEMKVFEFDENGNPSVTTLAERDVNTYDKLNNWLMNRNLIYAVDVSDHKELSVIFENGRALFMLDFLYDTEYLRDMNDDFGIVPMPKANEEQQSYHTQIGTSTSMFFVPKTTANPDLTSKVCEALSFYSSGDVVPAYYEVALKDKYTRDEAVQEMLEIICQSAQMDFTYAYSTTFVDFPNTIVECREGNSVNGNLASYFASKTPAWQGTVDKIMEAYAKIQ